MSVATGTQERFAFEPGAVRVIRLPRPMLAAGAGRLVKDAGSNAKAAGQKMLQTARRLGIDLSLMWATVDQAGAPGEPRQVCLAVVGSGRTATMFVSMGSPEGRPGSRGPAVADAERHERVLTITQACRYLGEPTAEAPRGVRLAQALLEPGEGEALMAFLGAGFSRLGDLKYLRLTLAEGEAGAPELRLPGGVTVRTAESLGPERAREALAAALERTYIGTLDCPELSGLREVSDVLESHHAVGRHDPALWWLVFRDGRPEGCMLLSAVPEQGSTELVYLGLGPELRGKGLARALLSYGLGRCSAGEPLVVTCAVDARNEPALRLYTSMGFVPFGERIPVVRALP